MGAILVQQLSNADQQMSDKSKIDSRVNFAARIYVHSKYFELSNLRLTNINRNIIYSRHV